MAAFGLRITFGLNRAELGKSGPAAGNRAAAPFALTRPCSLGASGNAHSAGAIGHVAPTMLS
jgi:hypothetical protein